MKLYDELKWRGLIKDEAGDDIEDKLNNECVTFYWGTDPSADSLHIGHYSSLVTAKRLAKAGHHPILLIGGSTGMIGDPRPTAEREILPKDKVMENAEKLKKQVVDIFDGNVEVVNNYEWTKDMTVLDFLRDIGKYINVGYMINKDIIKRGIVGGLIAGDVGAIIGATSAKTKMNTESIPEKLEFCIQTVDTELPYIEFKFNTYSTWISKNGSRDTMYGLFSNEDGKFNYHFSEQKRDGGSKCDCYFDRSFHIYEYDGNDPEEYEPVMDDIEYSNHLETLIHRFTKYSRKIETIINGNKF